jgi:hypothetical protein
MGLVVADAASTKATGRLERRGAEALVSVPTTKGAFQRQGPVPKCAARRRIGAVVDEYNQVRLHGTLGYITPAARLHGLAQVIFEERDRKLAEARVRLQPTRRAQRGIA